MTTQRWYPTALMLGDEQGPTGACARVLVAGGSGGTGGMEVYSEATNAFLPITVNGAITKHFNQTYPGLHMLPGGEIFYAPTGFANCRYRQPRRVRRWTGCLVHFRRADGRDQRPLDRGGRDDD